MLKKRYLTSRNKKDLNSDTSKEFQLDYHKSITKKFQLIS